MRAALAALSLLLYLEGAILASESISTSSQLPPLAMRQDQLADFVEGVNSFLVHTNHEIPGCKTSRSRLTLSDQSSAIEFDAAQVKTEVARLHDTQFKLELTYYCYANDAPISKFNLTLGDSEYQRNLAITGTEPEQVQALASMVLSKLSACKRFLTGFSVRSDITAGTFAVFFGGAIIIAILNTKGFKFKGASWLSVLLPTLSWVLLSNLNHWLYKIFPGFALYPGDTSWLVRYAPEIGFAGFLLSLISIFIAIWFQMKPRHVAGQ